MTPLPGITEPIQQVTLSSPLEGTLAKIVVDETSVVKSGDLLAALDTRALEADLAVANATSNRSADLERAQQELELAKQNLGRSKILKQRGAIALSRLQQDIAAESVAQSRVDAISEAMKEASLRRDSVAAAIEERSIRAPFSGRVLRVEGQLGQTIRQAEPIVRIANLTKLKADLHLPSSVMLDAKTGKQYLLWATSPIEKPVSATLVSKEPIVNAVTGTFRCRFEIDNSETNYPAGFSVGLIDLADPIHSQRRHVPPPIGGGSPDQKLE